MKPCLNLAGPSSKAKYSSSTDSELVPLGKGEKNPGRGVEYRETACLQKVGAKLEQPASDNTRLNKTLWKVRP